jgi:hypothetical protein
VIARETVLDGSGLAREGGAVRVVGRGNAAEVGDVFIERLLAIHGKVGKRFVSVVLHGESGGGQPCNHPNLYRRDIREAGVQGLGLNVTMSAVAVTCRWEPCVALHQRNFQGRCPGSASADTKQVEECGIAFVFSEL